MRVTAKIAGMTCFWIFSPESLVLSGNGAGRDVGTATLALLFFAVLAAWCAYFILTAEQQMAAQAAEFPVPGAVWLEVLAFAGIIGTTLFASTGLLVTAGYTFNEVFCHRFPNFAFAFLLLLLLLVMHVFPEKKHQLFQALLVLVTFSCLFTLVVRGGWTSVPDMPTYSVGPAGISVFSFLPLLLIFTGFDRMGLCSREWGVRIGVPALLIGAAFLLLCWMLVSARFVEADRLARSSIPYMTAAGKVMGQNGRLVMGAAIIAGSYSAVYGLMSICVRFMTRANYLDAPHPAWGKHLRISIAVVIAILMFSGFAGTDLLELFIRGALLLWMLHAGLYVLLISNTLKKTKPYSAFFGMLAGAMIVCCSALIVVFQEERTMMGLFLFCLLAGSTLCITLLRLIHKKHASQNDAQ